MSKVSATALRIAAEEIEEDYPVVGDLLRQAAKEIRLMRGALLKIKRNSFEYVCVSVAKEALK